MTIKRLLAAATDVILYSGISIACWMPFHHNVQEKRSAGRIDYLDLATWQFYLVCLGFALFLMKDAIGGKSVGKRMFGIALIDRDKKHTITPLKSVMNNSVSVFFPVNLFLFVATKGQRGIGDFFVKSIAVNSSDVGKQRQFRAGNLLLAALTSFLLLAFISVPSALRRLLSPPVLYYHNAYNESSSKNIEQYLLERFTAFSEAKVRMYDSCADIPVPYVTMQFMLKEDWAQNGSMDSLHKQMRLALDILFKDNPIRSDIMYRLEMDGRVSIWEMDYGYGSTGRMGYTNYVSF